VTLRAALVLAVLVGSTTSPYAQTVGTRQIAGRVTDAGGGALPGVRVTITGPGLLVAESTVVGNDGRFVVKGPLQPPPATYNVIAQLDGFETVAITAPASAADSDSTFTIRMRIPCMEPDLEVLGELDGYVKEADFAALVRLDSIERQQQPRVDDGYCGPITIFRATIVEAVKDRRPQRSGSIQFVLLGHRGQFEPGDEYIAVLQLHPSTRAYRVMSRGYFMLVKEGRVRWPSGDKYEPLSDLMTTLRLFSRR
jgi:hypothetical protein